MSITNRNAKQYGDSEWFAARASTPEIRRGRDAMVGSVMSRLPLIRDYNVLDLECGTNWCWAA